MGLESETGRGNCLGFGRPHRAPRSRPPAAPLRAPLPKELHALLLRLYGDPRAGTFTQYKKGAKKPKQVVNFSSPSRGEVFSL